MSDNFQMLVDVGVSLDEASALSDAIVAELRNHGLISGELTADCVLGGVGYRPGPSLANLYKPRPREGRFWELITSGVEPQVGRSFNHWALGPSCEGFTCPKCAASIEAFAPPFSDAMGDAIDDWLKGTDAAQLACPHCNQTTRLTEWESKPALGFGNLSFRFWNWPRFDVPAWKIDVPALVRRIAGHTVTSTYGHL